MITVDDVPSRALPCPVCGKHHDGKLAVHSLSEWRKAYRLRDDDPVPERGSIGPDETGE